MLTPDMLFTVLASSALLVLWVATGLVLPWTPRELDRVEADLDRLLAPLRTPDSAHRSSRRSSRRNELEVPDPRAALAAFGPPCMELEPAPTQG